jgi:hypothetical protein
MPSKKRQSNKLPSKKRQSKKRQSKKRRGQRGGGITYDLSSAPMAIYKFAPDILKCDHSLPNSATIASDIQGFNQILKGGWRRKSAKK